MKTTYRELFTFRNTAIDFVNAASEEKKPETLLTAALNDAIDDTEAVVQKYNKQLGRLRRKFAESDKKTSVLLKDEHGRYQYTEEGENNLEDAIEDLLDEEVYVEVERLSEVPTDLHRVLIKRFKGFIIDPNYQPKPVETE